MYILPNPCSYCRNIYLLYKALFLDLGDMESLFHEFDEVLSEKAVADNRLGLLDASSLLWRLDLLGIEVEEERWRRVTDALATHVGNHRSPWLVPFISSLS